MAIALTGVLLAGSVPTLAAAAPSVVPTAASGPLAPGVSAPGTPTPTTAAPTATAATQSGTSTSGSSSLGQGSVIGIVVGALVVLVGVTAFIFRDARRRAPARERRRSASSEDARRIPGSKRTKPRKLSPAERRRRKRGRASRR